MLLYHFVTDLKRNTSWGTEVVPKNAFLNLLLEELEAIPATYIDRVQTFQSGVPIWSTQVKLKNFSVHCGFIWIFKFFFRGALAEVDFQSSKKYASLVLFIQYS